MISTIEDLVRMKKYDKPTEVIFFPDWRQGNPYQDLLAKSLSTHGCNVSFSNYPNQHLPLLWAKLKNPKARIFHLHWIHPYTNHIIHSNNGLKRVVKLLLTALDMLIVRAAGVKIIWTVHNLTSHECANKKREIAARRILALTASKLIFHSKSAQIIVCKLLELDLTNKSKVIPHGNYENVYPYNLSRTEELRHALGIKNDQTIILFLGAVRQYKGAQTLVECFTRTKSDHLRLIVAGKPFDEKTRNDIIQAAKNDPRISLLLGFVNEDDISPLFTLANVVAIPFENTLTSGSALLALTQGKAIIMPKSARIIDLPDYSGTIFYDEDQTIQPTLENLPPNGDLERMGNINKSIASMLSWEKIGASTFEIYLTRNHPI